ncbi:MAG: glucosyl-3-phosphoglycerate synthase [Actinomycetota bacterium]|nr:glucosyl-3-phosphoglycerate synthase [Actinomycetota bacterium]
MASLLEAPSIATYRHGDFDPARLAVLKGGATVTVCIPARDEAATIGAIVGTIRRELGAKGAGLVDEILVVDDASSDGTGRVARREGATVIAGPGYGKGQAMGLACRRADIVVFLDGDVANFGAHFVTGLLGPLLTSPQTVLVKGAYERPVAGDPNGGGRVTELVAKPLLSLLFPELSGVSQPLAGETALRRRVLEDLELAPGYGVEIGLLIDVAERYGADAVAQVDLGVRLHRNRPLKELSSQAREVMQAALVRVRPAAP